MIPVILSLTGPGALIGFAESGTLKLLEKVTNRNGGVGGRPVQFEIFDDQSNPEVTVQEANAHIGDSPVVLGSELSALCAATTPLFANGPLDWCLAPAIDPVRGSYVFTASVSLQDNLNATVRFLREKGWTRIALLATTDTSGQSGEQALDRALASPGNQKMTILDREHFNPTDISVAAQVAKIQATRPQALVVWAAGTPLGSALRGIHDAGLAVPIVTTNANMVRQQLQSYATFRPNELFFPSVSYMAGVAPNPGVLQAQGVYFAALRASGTTPTSVTGMPWDAGMIVVDTLRHLGTSATSSQIRGYIANLRGWNGIHGVYDFTQYPQRGLGPNAVVMVRWNGSGFTAAGGFGGALRP